MQTRRSKLVLLVATTLLGVMFVLGTASSGLAAPGGNQSADLDQCANDPFPSPSTDGCNSNTNQWVNGNLGASKAVYFEGNSIPYRLRFGNLSLNSHTVTIEWDTSKGGKHALDYLTSFNYSVANANPCLGVSGCDSASPNTFAIPADPQVTGAGVTPVAGSFSMYGGTITAVSAYSYPNGSGFAGDKSARITLTFTASVANPVLAWGGHISTRLDWGNLSSAVTIPGSPYHTRLIDLDGSGGNQDRSLSNDAVIFPGSITIIKDAVPDSALDFGFTTTGGLSPASFTLDDDSDPTLSNTQLYSGISSFVAYTVTEGTATNSTLTGIVCTVTSPNGGSSSTNTSTRTATINMKEGENYTCTFSNHILANPSITTTLSSESVNVGSTVHDSATLSGATGDAGGTVTYTVYTDNQCSQGAQSAGTKTVTNGVVPDSDSITFNSAGDFYWQVVYSGDANNNGATSVCTSEHLVVNKASPGFLTVQNLLPNDKATISGAASNAGGTITFNLFSPSDAQCQSTPAFTQTLNVSGNGDYSTTNSSFLATDEGTWRWVVVYSGDANNSGFTAACGVENFTIDN